MVEVGEGSVNGLYLESRLAYFKTLNLRTGQSVPIPIPILINTHACGPQEI